MKQGSARLAVLLATLALAGSGFAAPAPATLTVTNASDSGAGSLRAAILAANAGAGTDTITFNIAGGGVHTIVLATALPDVTDAIIIDGRTQPGFTGTPLIEVNGAAIAAGNAVLTLSAGNSQVYGLALNRGPDAGLRIRTTGNNTIGTCAIGTDPSGTLALGNATYGIVIENVSGNWIGNGPNVISGNGSHGIFINGAAATNTLVQTAFVGTDATGTLNLSNGGYGVLITDGGNNTVGNGLISFNALGGIAVQGATTSATLTTNGIFGNGGPGIGVASGCTGIKMIDNWMSGNAGPGIDLNNDGRTPNDPGDADVGANNLQNFAVLTKISFFTGSNAGNRMGNLEGTLDSLPSTNYTLEIFFSTFEAQDNAQIEYNAPHTSTLIMTDASGIAHFNLPILVPGPTRSITATVTDVGGNTSELSPAFAIPDVTAKSGCGASGAEVLLALGLAGLVRRCRARRP